MSQSEETKYVTAKERQNQGAVKYHTDLDCHMLPDEYTEVTEHDERLNIQPCSYCAGGATYDEIKGLWDE